MKKRCLAIGVSVALGLMMLAGCGSKSSSSVKNEFSDAKSSAAYDAAAPAQGVGEAAEMPAAEPEEGQAQELTENAAESRKLIKTVYLDMETRNFDEMIVNISEKVEELGGYLEQSQVQGSGYNQENGRRYASMVARVPAAKLNGFVDQVSGMGNVINKQESVEDVTLSYVDVESRINALKVEQQRLTELLAQAESVDAIIALESRLSEVRYELESYESQLRTYDNQVDYSTVSMNIQEVERITQTKQDTVLERISSGLSDNFYNLGQGLLNFFIWFVVSLPYILLLAVIGLIVWLVLHISTRRHRKKMEARRQNMQHPQPMPPQSQARGGRQPQQVPPQGAQPQDAGVPKEQMPPKRAGESQEPQQVPPKRTGESQKPQQVLPKREGESQELQQVPPKKAGESQEPHQIPPQKQEPDLTTETVIPDKIDKEKEKDGESKL